MDWLVGVLLLIVGGIIGYFVAKYFNGEEKTRQSGKESEQTVKELMAQQAIEHLQKSKQIAQQISQQSAALNEHIADYEQSLIAHNSGDEANKLSYFGEHATTYLRNKSENQNREKDNSNIQPLDFSAESSGLFSGAKGSDTTDGK